MFSGKIAALCLCPALVATPAVIATHPKMRHAVAHMMHRAADRLETPVAVAEPLGHCPASYASDIPSGSQPGNGLSGLSPQDMSALQRAPFPLRDNGFGQSGSSFSSPTSGLGGFRGDVAAPPGSGGGPGVVVPPPPTEGVTEPQNWALLVTGFAVTGLLLRHRRPKLA